MSRAQLTDQQSQHASEGESDRTKDDIHGLPPYLFGRVMALRPGDVEGLRTLLSLHREMSQQILAAASPHVGISTVRQAIDAASAGATGAEGSLSQQDVAPGGEYALEDSPAVPAPAIVRPGALTQSEIRPGGELALDGEAATKAPVVADPPWVASARRYNTAHAELVDEFHDLTDFVCREEDTSGTNPKAVAAWQRNHGLDPDGKIGHQTVAAARANKAKGATASSTPAQSDARIPV
jgi:hypothetical protein